MLKNIFKNIEHFFKRPSILNNPVKISNEPSQWTTKTDYYQPADGVIDAKEFVKIMKEHINQRMSDIKKDIANNEPGDVDISKKLIEEDYAILVRFTNLQDRYQKFVRYIDNNEFKHAQKLMAL